MIVDQSKTQVEIGSQIDVSAKEFQKLENPDGIQEEGNQFYEGGWGDILTAGGKMGHPHSEMFDAAKQKERNDPKRRGGERRNPWKLN